MKVYMDNKGATLVELLVAASIMVVVVFAVLAVIRVGSEIEVADNHRRVARSHISSWFEENFTAEDYYTISVPEDGEFFHHDDKVELDPTRNEFFADFSVVVTDGNFDVGTNGYDVPYVSAAATISWVEVGGKTESVVLNKMITGLGSNEID